MKLGRKTGVGAAATIAVLVAASLPSIAYADDASAAGILERAEAVAVGTSTPANASVPVVQAGGDGVTAGVNGSDLSVTLGADGDATISTSGQYATVEDTSVTYAVSHPEDGATRFSAILTSSADTTPEWSFEAGTELLLLDNGSVSVSDGESFLGGIDAPWAVDAEGRSLPTHYEISGTTLTQVVDTTGATFPVVADPTVQFFGPYIQVHLNRHESITAVSGFAACATILSKSKVAFAKLLQVACGSVVAIGSAQLVAGKCISVHYVVGVGGPAGVWWPWIRNC